MRIPTAAEYSRALDALASKLSESDKHLIKSVRNVADRDLSAAELALAAGYRSYSSANALYGRLGHRIWLALGRNPSELPRTTGGKPLWTEAIAAGYRDTVDQWRWRLRPNFVKAVLYLYKPDDTKDIAAAAASRNVASEFGLIGIEGGKAVRIHVIRERNPTLVQARKRLQILNGKKLECEVCGFNFEKYYGERGENFIECHHTKPISQRKAAERTMLEDLALVCSNCHKMIHVRQPWLSIDELRRVLRRRMKNRTENP